MNTTKHDEIRQAVRHAYKKVAQAASYTGDAGQAPSCCVSSSSSAAGSCRSGGAGLSLEQLSSAMGVH